MTEGLVLANKVGAFCYLWVVCFVPFQLFGYFKADIWFIKWANGIGGIGGMVISSVFIWAFCIANSEGAAVCGGDYLAGIPS